jgi:two-component system, cell cycle sensor histidine kinase and response regulator CckA
VVAAAGDHRRLQAFFDHALDGILIAGDDGRYVDANRAACEILGYTREELLGRTPWQLAPEPNHAEAHAQWRDFIAQGEMRGMFQIRRGDGAIRDLSFSARAAVLPGLHMSIIRDVTEQRRIERQLLGAQRMEAVGRLAGGVAHDFNNLLTVILGFTSELLDSYPDDPHIQELLGEVKRAGERAADMTRQLLAFSRRQTVQPRRFNLNDAVSSMSAMCTRLIGEDVHFALQLHDEPLFIESDRGQIEQVVTNLVVNARDAMPKGGRVTVATARRIDPQSPSVNISPGSYAELTVTDTGEGIAPEHIGRIFEPFFTTKTSGKGTGLGLATVYGIVKQAGGFITVDSAPGRGTTFRVLLPLQDSASDHEAPPERLPDSSPAGERVLLVEDEALVRDVAARLLERAGFRIVAAPSAEAALDLLRTSAADFDVIVSDVVMPRISGPELAARVREFAPDIPFVFMSGYPTDHSAMGGEWRRDEPLVTKPLELVPLVRAVSQALESKRRSHG